MMFGPAWDQVYDSKKLIKKATTGASVVGALLAMMGVVMVGHALYVMRRKPNAESMPRDLEQVRSVDQPLMGGQVI